MALKRTKVVDIFAPELIGSKVCVKGWVRTRRGNKHVQFIALNDGSTIKNIQIVIDLEKFTDDELKTITTGSSLHVEGELVASQGKDQSVEIQAETIEVYGTADPEEYPLQKKGHTLEFLREKAHLRMRTTHLAPCSAFRHNLAFAIHKFFNDKGFYYLNTPLITASDCEGAARCSR
jgi:asparaginyl-tRNA synthetase